MLRPSSLPPPGVLRKGVWLAEKRSPTTGTSVSPSTSQGVEGDAVFMRRPDSSRSARTLPHAAPALTVSPTDNVPSWTRNWATGPRPLSMRASRTTPCAGPIGFAVGSSSSATSSTDCSRSGSPSWVLAETRQKMASPPQSSGVTSRSASCRITSSGSADGLSILLTATTMGTPAARAWLRASIVCSFTPSSAATTRMTTSVTPAPRARILVNASCPGVSRKTRRWPFVSTE